MTAIIVHSVLSALAIIVGGYMQIKGIGSPELITAILAIGGGNGAVAAKRAVDKSRDNKKDSDAEADYKN